jgi:hypothetical protein
MEPVTFYQYVKEIWVMSSGCIRDPDAEAVCHDFGRGSAAGEQSLFMSNECS